MHPRSSSSPAGHLPHTVQMPGSPGSSYPHEIQIENGAPSGDLKRSSTAGIDGSATAAELKSKRRPIERTTEIDGASKFLPSSPQNSQRSLVRGQTRLRVLPKTHIEVLVAAADTLHEKMLARSISDRVALGVTRCALARYIVAVEARFAVLKPGRHPQEQPGSDSRKSRIHETY